MRTEGAKVSMTKEQLVAELKAWRDSVVSEEMECLVEQFRNLHRYQREVQRWKSKWCFFAGSERFRQEQLDTWTRLEETTIKDIVTLLRETKV